MHTSKASFGHSLRSERAIDKIVARQKAYLVETSSKRTSQYSFDRDTINTAHSSSEALI